MASLVDLIQSDLGRQIINGVSNETSQPEDKTAAVVSMAIPLLMGAMKRNTSKSEGASGLMNALNAKHDGSILDNLGELFGGGVNEEVKIDGLGILGHVLGGSQDNVVAAISKKSGVDSNSVMQILAVLAPIVLGYLGKEKQQQNVQSESGLDSLLGGMLGGGRRQQKRQQSLIETLLDGDGDGSVVDDIAGMVLGGGSKSKKGGLLGSLFGR